MKILCVLTESHRVLFDEYFIKTVPCPDYVIVQELQLKGQGCFGSVDWQSAVSEKIEFVLDYMKNDINDSFFIFSDVDVQFFPSFSKEELKLELIRSNKDILFQKESKKKDNLQVNTGFYVARTSPSLISFFEQVSDLLQKSEFRNDQKCINKVLLSSNIKWGFLSKKYYARTHGFPPPETVCCHHANRAGTVDKKIKQIKLVRSYHNSSIFGKLLFTLMLRVHNRYFRFIGNKNRIL